MAINDVTINELTIDDLAVDDLRAKGLPNALAVHEPIVSDAAPGGVLPIDPALLARVEGLMGVEVRSGVPWLDAALEHVLARPAGRIRPALLFAAARRAPYGRVGREVLAAAAVELLHLASLVHDDLMDDAVVRGTEPTLQAVHGTHAAVLSGDRLLAAGGRLAVRAGADVALAWQDAYRDMCAGQARELGNRYRLTPVEQYLLAVRGKTAALMRASCLLGARCAGLPEAQVEALSAFGDAFGTLYQLLDDLMDVVSAPELLGKPVHHDIGQGVYTLPVLLSAQLPGSPLKDLLVREPTPSTVAAAYTAVRPEAIEATLSVLYGYADRARAALAGLPGSSGVAALGALPARYLADVLGRRVVGAYRGIVRGL